MVNDRESTIVKYKEVEYMIRNGKMNICNNYSNYDKLYKKFRYVFQIDCYFVYVNRNDDNMLFCDTELSSQYII